MNARSSAGLPGVTEPRMGMPTVRTSPTVPSWSRVTRSVTAGASADGRGFGRIRRPDETGPPRDRILRRDGLGASLERARLALRKRAGDLPEVARVARQLLGGRERDCARA